METLTQIYARQVAAKFFCDRGTIHSYIDIYEKLFAPYRESAERVLEIGVYDGGGLIMLEQYFHNAEVHGIDCDERPHGGKADLRPLIATGKHRIHIMDAADESVVADNFQGSQSVFDIVIDDAAHNLDQQVRLFSIWSKRLAPGGLYVIEDIQDVDKDRVVFEALVFEVIDRRKVKSRYDDVLAIYRK